MRQNRLHSSFSTITRCYVDSKLLTGSDYRLGLVSEGRGHGTQGANLLHIVHNVSDAGNGAISGDLRHRSSGPASQARANAGDCRKPGKSSREPVVGRVTKDLPGTAWSLGQWPSNNGGHVGLRTTGTKSDAPASLSNGRGCLPRIFP